jgi:hypothetical protein
MNAPTPTPGPPPRDHHDGQVTPGQAAPLDVLLADWRNLLADL